MPETPAIVRCLTCNHPFEWSQRSPYRPFCSRRCKLIDLGDWLDGNHYIPETPWDGEAPDMTDDEPSR